MATNLKTIPRHVAIIMDGNRRFAKKKLLDYEKSYVKAIDSINSSIDCALNYKIAELTLFAFSKENKNRPASEVSLLKNLIMQYLESLEKTILAKNIKLKIIGDYHDFDTEVAKKLDILIAETKDNTSLVLTVAINYSGKDDLIRAVNRILKDNKTSEVTEGDITNNLYTNYLKDPDILIRTGKTKRISNFFLWQLAYTELFFLDILWPEFSLEHFEDILKEFQERERRYGL